MIAPDKAAAVRRWHDYFIAGIGVEFELSMDEVKAIVFPGVLNKPEPGTVGVLPADVQGRKNEVVTPSSGVSVTAVQATLPTASAGDSTHDAEFPAAPNSSANPDDRAKAGPVSPDGMSGAVARSDPAAGHTPTYPLIPEDARRVGAESHANASEGKVDTTAGAASDGDASKPSRAGGDPAFIPLYLRGRSGTAREAPGSTAPSDGIAELEQRSDVSSSGELAARSARTTEQDGVQPVARNHQPETATSGEAPAGAAVGESPAILDAGPTDGANVGGENEVATQDDTDSERASPALGGEGRRADADVLGSDVEPVAPPSTQSPPSERLSDRVKALFIEHPDYTAPKMAQVLGTQAPLVRKAARVAGVTLRKVTSEERSAIHRAAAVAVHKQKFPGRPVPAPTAERKKQPIAKLPAHAKKFVAERPVEPVADSVTSLPQVQDDVPVSMPIKRPKGTRFRLRVGIGEGKYLHMSCVGLTSQKNFSWIGTEAQLLAVRQKFPDAKDLREEIVE